MIKYLFLFALIFTFCTAEIYFEEEFNDGWENRWVLSEHKKADGTDGKFGISTGKFFKDAEADKGLQTTENARFYQISAEMKEFSNKGKDLVIQYSVKHEQGIDCGGAYVKLLPAGLDQLNFNGDSVYNIMFGPDICGGTKRTHAILNYKGTNHLISKDIKTESDVFTHLFTFIIHPDQTYEVLIDNKEVRKGNLVDDWKFLPPRQIKDPNAFKPKDWVDEKEIEDPEAVKPEDWDNEPAQIQDPNAVKPEDWDDELDGEWEAPTIDNPEYRGPWKAPLIKNPEYKGEWVHPLIDNPEFVEDSEIYAFPSHKYIGFELWQVKAGSIFDNILVTDDVNEAAARAARTLELQETEKSLKEQADAESRASSPSTPEEEEGEDEDAGDLEGLEDLEGFEGLQEGLYEDEDGDDSELEEVEEDHDHEDEL